MDTGELIAPRRTFARIAAVVAVSGALHLVSMLWATGGCLALPLDDSFIYFRYGEAIAAGRGLAYHAGDAPTTGATSLPWTLVLSLGSLLGFGGRAMIPWAMAAGGAALALAAWAAGRAGHALAPRRPGSERPGDLALAGIPFAAALVLVSGPLAWGAWSGMEIPLTAAAAVAALAAWARAGGVPDRGVALALAGLAVVRPEGAMLAGLAIVLAAAGAAAGTVPRRSIAWLALPLAAMLVVPAIAWALTGDARSSGFLAKTALGGPGADVAGAARVALLRAASLLGAQLFGLAPRADGLRLYAYESETAALFVPPGAGLVFLLGILPALAREAAERRAGAAALSAAWIAALYLATGLLEEPDAHHGRYQMPVLPVFLVWVAHGTGRLVRGLRDLRAGLARLGTGVRAALLAGGCASFAFFALAFGDQCEDIERMQIAWGEALPAIVEPGAVVAVNDAGALAYFSGVRTLDLVGLTSPGLAGAWRQGSGVLYEALEAMPPGRRPAWFCIFPNWFDLEPAGILRSVAAVRLLSPSVVDAEKVLSRADWTLAGSGDAPAAGPGARVVDRVDVADAASERAHAWRERGRERGASGGSFVRRGAAAPAGAEIVDGGRVLLGEATFEVARDPVADARLVLRLAGGRGGRVVVAVGDGPPQDVELAAAATPFHEQAVARIPHGTGRVRVRLAAPAGAPTLPLYLCHAFVLAGGAAP